MAHLANLEIKHKERHVICKKVVFDITLFLNRLTAIGC